MTVKISPQKASRILEYFFGGIAQPEIARRCGVNQATVSRYASILRATADDVGITAAAKEYGVMHEVDSLRSLAVELSKGKLTTEEAKEGVSILRLFNSLDVPSSEHKRLIEVISKLKDPQFVPAAMKLVKLEADTGKNYPEIVSHFEHLSSEGVQLQQSNAALKQENESLRQDVKQLSKAKKVKEQEVRELEERAEQRRAAIETEMDKRMEDTNLTLKRIERLEPMSQTLKKLGISDDELEGYLREHQKIEELGIGFRNFKAAIEPVEPSIKTIDADRFGKRLAEYGSLDNAIEAIRNKLASSQSNLERLEGNRARLRAGVERLSKRKMALSEEVKDLRSLKQTLSQTTDAMEHQREQLEEYLPGLERNVETMEIRKSALEKESYDLEEKVNEMKKRFEAASEVDRELTEKIRALQEIQGKIASAGSRFELFESLLGFIAANESPQLEGFLESIPFLIEKARGEKYDASFLKRYILRTLTWDSLEVLDCGQCGTEFVVLGRAKTRDSEFYKRYEGERRCCPICGERSRVFVNKDISEVLEQELKSPPQA